MRSTGFSLTFFSSLFVFCFFCVCLLSCFICVKCFVSCSSLPHPPLSQIQFFLYHFFVLCLNTHAVLSFSLSLSRSRLAGREREERDSRCRCTHPSRFPYAKCLCLCLCVCVDVYARPNFSSLIWWESYSFSTLR